MGYRNYGSDPFYDSWRFEHRREHYHHHRRPYDGYGRDNINPCRECSPLPPIGPRPYPRGRAPYRDFHRYY